MTTRRTTGTRHYCPVCKAPVDKVDTVCLNCEASRPPTGWPVDSYVGRVLGQKYRIDRRLSVGGFGMVFLATQVHQGQELGQVIIKMLHTEHAFDPVVTRRFVNEVKAARSIHSSHVVKIFDMDFDRGNVPYMVQEFVEGEGLAEILEQQVSLPVSRSVSIALQVAEGMDEAHGQEIIHRDLKPENIILQRLKRADFVKIIDFGIARLAAPGGNVSTSFVGTPRYMPPEQIKGKKMDGRADIFALGVILFEMIAGHPPISAPDSDLEYLTLNCTQEPDRLRDVDPLIPPTLDALVDSMMAKDPEDRPASMHEVVERLSVISHEMGYAMELTGERTISSDGPTAVDGPGRDLLTTPVSGDFARQIREQKPARSAGIDSSPGRQSQTSEPFTHERPASGQHDPARGTGVSLPVLAIVAGTGGFAVLAAVLVIVFITMSMRGKDPPPQPADQPPAKAEVQPATPLPEAKTGVTPDPVEKDASTASTPPPATDSTTPEPTSTETARDAGTSPDEQEPDAAAPPEKKPPKKKPPKKKPPKKKPPKKDDNPWTKL